MDANRLTNYAEFLKKPETMGLNKYTAAEIVGFAIQQQEEIKRLKEDNRRLHVICDERSARANDYLRAYEVLEQVMEGYAIQLERARIALDSARQIKDGDHHGNSA